MDKGIRVGVTHKFFELMPLWREMGGRSFRKAVLDWTVENYGIGYPAASTHYNFAFKLAKQTTPEAVEGLGRAPEKNNGGRKRKAVEAEAVIVEDNIKPAPPMPVVGRHPLVEDSVEAAPF